MKNKLFKYFCAGKAFVAALSLLILALSVGVADGQTRKTKADSEQPEAVFTNPAAITIVDATGTEENPIPSNANPYPSTISVSGLTGTIPTTPGSVKVTLNGFSHTFPDDVGILLVGPTGAALLLQSGVAQGQDANNITYTFSDSGATQLPDDTAITAGTFKPTAHYTGDSFPAPGPGTTYGNPGPAGGGTATFASVFGGTNPNGNWNLFVRDFVPGDSGSISGGWSLEITTGGGTAQPFDNRLDYFDRGFSDWAVLSAPTGGNFIWTIARNDNPTPVNGRVISFPFGLAPTSNEPAGVRDQIPAFGDYTGDGGADISIWRPGAQALYWILPSETTQASDGIGPAFSRHWGTTGTTRTDVSGAEGDYDGDGKLDMTVISNEGGGIRWFVMRSGSNTFSTFLFGASATDYVLPGADYTADGSDDPTVARVNETTGEILWIVGTTSGGLINKVSWGNFDTDYIIPAGDYDGDSKADFVVWRGFGAPPAVNGEWFILKSSGGTTIVPFGIPFPSNTNRSRDIALRSGDYDGDKKTDIAVWRPSNQTFYVLRSSNGQLMSQKWGFADSRPVANLGVF